MRTQATSGIEFLRRTRPYPQIREAVQAEEWQRRQHYMRLFRAFMALDYGLNELENGLREARNVLRLPRHSPS